MKLYFKLLRLLSDTPSTFQASVPATIPSPLPKWSKWAISLGATPSSYLVSFLDYLGTMDDSNGPQPGEWRHVQIVYTNTLTNLAADEFVVTMDLANITNGGIDASWTSSDYATTDAQLVNLIASTLPVAAPHTLCKEIRYYRRVFNPYSNFRPFPPSGAPDHVHSVNAPGTATSSTANQVAVTHTERTTYPRHWGRAYWPANGHGTTIVAAGGMIASGMVDAIATGVQAAYDALSVAEFFPLIATTTVGGVASRNLLGVTAIQVDNVFDVQRRRRPFSATYRKILPVQ